MSDNYAFRTGAGPLDVFIIDIDAPDERPEETVQLLATAEILAAADRIRAEGGNS